MTSEASKNSQVL